MAWRSYKEDSRNIDWAKLEKHGALTGEEISLGCQLRIADALELMTKDKAEMERENLKLRGYKAQAETQDTELSVERHRCAALRGIVTRLKKQAKKGR
jgi:hypothetical protein